MPLLPGLGMRRERPAGYRHIGLELGWQGGLVRLLESAEHLVDPARFHVNRVRLIVFVLAGQRNCIFSRFKVCRGIQALIRARALANFTAFFRDSMS